MTQSSYKQDVADFLSENFLTKCCKIGSVDPSKKLCYGTND